MRNASSSLTSQIPFSYSKESKKKKTFLNPRITGYLGEILPQYLKFPQMQHFDQGTALSIYATEILAT